MDLHPPTKPLFNTGEYSPAHMGRSAARSIWLMLDRDVQQMSTALLLAERLHSRPGFKTHYNTALRLGRKYQNTNHKSQTE